MSQDDVDEFTADPVGKIADAYTQMATGGAVGYDSKTGKLKEGYSSHAVDEGLGEVTGRNAARAANDEQRTAAAKAAADKKAQDEADQRRKGMLDTQASNYAGSVRDSAEQIRAKNLGSTPQTDYLGL